MRELNLPALHQLESLACNLGNQLRIIWNAQSSRLHHFFQISENVSLAWNGQLDSNAVYSSWPSTQLVISDMGKNVFSSSANSASISRVHLQGLDSSCLLTRSSMFFFSGPLGSTASRHET